MTRVGEKGKLKRVIRKRRHFRLRQTITAGYKLSVGQDYTEKDRGEEDEDKKEGRAV